MILGILITLISMYYQQVLFKKNEVWRSANKHLVIERIEFAMPGYRKKSTITIFFIYLGLLTILISLSCRLIIS